jgi:hypothetical protein
MAFNKQRLDNFIVASLCGQQATLGRNRIVAEKLGRQCARLPTIDLKANETGAIMVRGRCATRDV